MYHHLAPPRSARLVKERPFVWIGCHGINPSAGTRQRGLRSGVMGNHRIALAEAPEWELRDDARRIDRTFRFRNFRETLAFVQRVGELAETEGHHPDISFGWGYATVSLSTKKIKGLHENDFIMASKIDRMLSL